MDYVEAKLKEFDENIPPRGMHPDAGDFQENGESAIYPFGYKRLIGDEIFTVTDWGNIKKFLKESLIEAKAEGAREAVDYLASQYGTRENMRGLIILKLEDLKKARTITS